MLETLIRAENGTQTKHDDHYYNVKTLLVTGCNYGSTKAMLAQLLQSTPVSI